MALYPIGKRDEREGRRGRKSGKTSIEAVCALSHNRVRVLANRLWMNSCYFHAWSMMGSQGEWTMTDVTRACFPVQLQFPWWRLTEFSSPCETLGSRLPSRSLFLVACSSKKSEGEGRETRKGQYEVFNWIEWIKLDPEDELLDISDCKLFRKSETIIRSMRGELGCWLDVCLF